MRLILDQARRETGGTCELLLFCFVCGQRVLLILGFTLGGTGWGSGVQGEMVQPL